MIRCKKFTMVEIMMVALVIGLLATIGFGTYTYAMNSAKESATKATIKKLEVALESLKTKHGIYLPQAVDDKIHMGADKLLGTSHTNIQKVPNYQTDFRKAVDAESLTIEGGVVIDAWGNPIYYVCPGIINKNSFDLISFGRDGLFHNTKKTEFSKSYTIQDFEDWDDLTNFKD